MRKFVTSRTQVGRLALIVGSILFGLIGFFGKHLFAEGFSVGEILVQRFLLAALLLTAFCLVRNPRLLMLNFRQLVLALALGFFGYAVFATLYFTAIKGVSVALAAMLLYTYPSWVTLMSGLFKIERIRAIDWALLFFSSCGLGMALWGQIEVHSALAFLAGLGSAVTYSAYILISARFQKDTHPLSSTVFVSWGAFVGLALLHLPSLAKMQSLLMTFPWLILGLSVLCTVLPILLILVGLQRTPSSESVLITMIEPVTAVLIGVIAFHESISTLQAAGIIIVLISLLLKTLNFTQKN